ncbi:alpha/beta fold hydrolase [Lysinibacillus endophyticus]|uniref:alpha/beta fold hydrolase n=1 Tax=Ureibacillus endophyticus TaxID=1978490 RepID=UPI00209E949D|nr:alpha/beta hydrolase [Lysinibacillus endophyticus]MCP1146781.1 alpha/beta hydrolase [Lysinibacillus endophyticus]
MSFPIVYLSGTLCTTKLWVKMSEDLEFRNLEIIINLNEGNTIEEMAKRVLAKINGRFILAGLSLGGIVALKIATMAPERIEKLILFNTNPFLPTEMQFSSWIANRKYIEEYGFNRFVEDKWVPSLINEKNSLFDLVKEMALDVGEDIYFNQLNAVETREDLTKKFSTIKCPTLIFVGDEDRICPVEMSEYLHENIENSTLIILPETGHLSVLEQPQKIAEIIQSWLRIH